MYSVVHIYVLHSSVLVYNIFAEEKCVLIDWVGEDSYSLVKGGRVNNGSHRIREVSEVKFRAGHYDGLVHVVAAGKPVVCTQYT